ncbi:MutS-related protein [Butyrivibrio proteoclasticus]|uniref:MutS-related protein n=1 Tax=Butyrivibrio proteoclasticus TaxID=43305 RepID=UPI00047DC885|nr:hypothetical protein [Butyrivibrio proteoclasticus]
MEAIIFLAALVGVSFIAFLLGLRDQRNARKLLLKKLIKDFGDAPNRKYKEDDFDHIPGYFLRHRDGFQIDDTTWNDLNMDGVFARMNYCLSASGEEYLYYMLRTPRQEDDFDELESHIEFFRHDHEARRKIQLIYGTIGRRIRYSIYDYLDQLDKYDNYSNKKHYLMLVLMAASIGLCFYNFTLGFCVLIGLMAINILSYFKVKGDIEPFIATYGYIMNVYNSVDEFKKLDYKEIRDDVDQLIAAQKKLTAFNFGSYILMSPTRMNSGGNPIEAIVDYLRMALHLDIIKFNQMFKEIRDNKDAIDEIITITGKLEAEISIACFRESYRDHFCIPEFAGDSYVAKELIHPLIADPVANSIVADKGVLLTGSNASGKSTFLKTCGVNALLAQSTHTALADQYKAPMYRIYSSMALTDNLFEGDSYYIVEIKSIKRILDAAREKGCKVLCFVDEVLRGTNTIERIAASTQILKVFADSKIKCFAATHDIELTQLLKEQYQLYHFEGNVSDNDVHFDYVMKDGPATNRNAIKLLGALGYDKDIVDKAQHMADRFLESGSWK